VTPRLKV